MHEEYTLDWSQSSVFGIILWSVHLSSCLSVDDAVHCSVRVGVGV